MSASDADGERLGVNYWVRCQLSLILNTALNNRKLEPGSVIKGGGAGKGGQVSAIGLENTLGPY